MKFRSAALASALMLALGTAAAQAPVVNKSITETEVLAAQRAWGDALVAISTAPVAELRSVSRRRPPSGSKRAPGPHTARRLVHASAICASGSTHWSSTSIT